MPDSVNKQASKKEGLGKLLENILRKFTLVGFLLMIFFIAFLYILAMGISLTPAFYFFQMAIDHSPSNFIYFFKGIAIAAGYIAYGLTLIFVVPILNYPFLKLLKPTRGPWVSSSTIPWYVHNALTYLVRYTFLDFITPSPMNILFFKMMGMKIGKGVMINSSNISDPGLIELGDYVTIGGSVYMMAHYGMKGYLIIDKLVIGSKSNIGLCAKILGSVTIGESVTVAPNSTIMPKTVLANGEKYGM